ncbi:hypothetical protein N9V96_03095 [Polaribacter sp.]|nr:hypothetical protein [Polaribacter sp.]
MKKVITVLVFAFICSIATNAQPPKREKMSVDKVLTKMTKDLDLSEAQQNEIKQLLQAQEDEVKASMEERKKLRDSGERPSKEMRQKMRKEREAKEKEMDAKLESILTDDQFEKYQKEKEERKEKRKKMREDL